VLRLDRTLVLLVSNTLCTGGIYYDDDYDSGNDIIIITRIV
jgi:hypothetical protein